MEATKWIPGRCDKEVGSYKRGWHVCGRAAKFSRDAKYGNGLTINFCTKHARAALAGSRA